MIRAAASGNRVLALTLTSRDAANISSLLDRSGLPALACRDMARLCSEVEAGVGLVVLPEEAMSAEQYTPLRDLLQRQPPWSDLPVMLLTKGGQNSSAALKAMQTLGNVIVLERPVRMSTFVVAARTALRDRARQYLTREHLTALEEADRRKNEFLAMLAHELRNPLAPIRNAMQVLNMRGTEADTVQWARGIVDRQVLHLTRLIDDLLDVSRITRGSVTLQRESLLLENLVARAVETIRPQMDARKQQLSVKLPGHPVSMSGDMTRLVQAVSNLLHNASKYTPERGHVTLEAGQEGTSLRISIRDDGIGIPRHMLGSIFELFTQVDTSIDRSYGGLGIGLTLVRSIVAMHGGTVRADSAGTGQGSEFTVVLPCHAAAVGPTPLSPSATRACGGRRRVLVVDDNSDAGQSLAILLRECGYEVRTAETGAAALELMDPYDPEAVLLDISLPGMDGYEIARRIRERNDTPRQLLVALTGYGGEETRQRATQAGFDRHLTKPVDLEELEDLLAAGLGERPVVRA